MVAPKVCNKEKETASSEIKGKKYRNIPGKAFSAIGWEDIINEFNEKTGQNYDSYNL